MKRIMLIGLLMCVTAAGAQERFDRVVRRNAWNEGLNAAGIRQDTLSRSYAEAYFTKENGGLADYSASDDSWNAGAATASIRHFGKVSFAGRFAYDYFDGRNMSGSMFTRPGYYPIDIVEFTPGRKIRERYALSGAVAAELGRRWTGGVKIAFEAQNTAKRKDLRHRNTMLDFEAAPGVMYRAEGFAAGAAYLIGTNSDRTKAEQLGDQGRKYEVFFDKGLAYGLTGLWDSSGLHLDEAGVTEQGTPVRETVQGAGVQVEYGPVYADAAYRYRDGKAGEKDVTWYGFDASQLTARAVLSLPGRRSHFVRLGLDYLTQHSREYLYDKQTVGGVTTTYTYGTTPVFGRKRLDLSAEYELQTARAELRAGAAYTRLDRESTLMYPYVRGQELHYTRLFASLIRAFGQWELSLAADLRTGGFRDTEKRLESTAEPGEYPAQLTAYHAYESEYLTATRVGAGVGLRRNIGSFYVDASARYEHGFDLQAVAQPNRVRATLSVGYNF